MTPLKRAIIITLLVIIVSTIYLNTDFIMSIGIFFGFLIGTSRYIYTTQKNKRRIEKLSLE